MVVVNMRSFKVSYIEWHWLFTQRCHTCLKHGLRVSIVKTLENCWIGTSSSVEVAASLDTRLNPRKVRKSKVHISWGRCQCYWQSMNENNGNMNLWIYWSVLFNTLQMTKCKTIKLICGVMYAYSICHMIYLE